MAWWLPFNVHTTFDNLVEIVREHNIGGRQYCITLLNFLVEVLGLSFPEDLNGNPLWDREFLSAVLFFWCPQKWAAFSCPYVTSSSSSFSSLWGLAYQISRVTKVLKWGLRYVHFLFVQLEEIYQKFFLYLQFLWSYRQQWFRWLIVNQI